MSSSKVFSQANLGSTLLELELKQLSIFCLSKEEVLCEVLNKGASLPKRKFYCYHTETIFNASRKRVTKSILKTFIDYFTFEPEIRTRQEFLLYKGVCNCFLFSESPDEGYRDSIVRSFDSYGISWLLVRVQ